MPKVRIGPQTDQRLKDLNAEIVGGMAAAGIDKRKLAAMTNIPYSTICYKLRNNENIGSLTVNDVLKIRDALKKCS